MRKFLGGAVALLTLCGCNSTSQNPDNDAQNRAAMVALDFGEIGRRDSNRHRIGRVDFDERLADMRDEPRLQPSGARGSEFLGDHECEVASYRLRLESKVPR